MLVDVVRMLLRTAAAFLGGMLLLRAYMTWLRVGYHNPIAQFVVAVTDWAVRPLRSVLPRTPRWDWGSLLAALLVALLFLALDDAIGGRTLLDWPWLLPLAVGLLLRWALYIALTLVFAYALLSIVNPEAPLAPTFDLLTRPLLAPFRRVMPLVGGFDLSPLALIVVIQILLFIIERSGV
jgi:YggT family protein